AAPPRGRPSRSTAPAICRASSRSRSRSPKTIAATSTPTIWVFSSSKKAGSSASTSWWVGGWGRRTAKKTPIRGSPMRWGLRDSDDRRLRSAVRRIVETVHTGVRFTPQQNLLLTDIPDRRQGLVERILADHGVARPGPGTLSIVRRWSMACPALPTCGLALAEAERVLPDVITELEGELETLGVVDAALTVRMTGCPNGCARPYTADLAFVGRSLNKYAVFVGGSMLGTRLGTQ